MASKRWFFTCIAAVGCVLVLAAAVMIDIDPFFHYHGPVEGRPYALYGSGAYEKYYNDGISRNFTYDAIITGSSVTENFKASQMEQLWDCQTIKTCFAGGTLREINEFLERALSRNKEIKYVVRGIDENKLLQDKDAKPDNLPEYLYDNNIFNDVNYWYNKDTWLVPLKRNIELMVQERISTNFDQYSNWSMHAVFSKEEALSKYTRPEKADTKAVLTEEMQKNLDGNIEENIVSLVRENPDVTFYYFLTPTSILQWDEWNRQGMTELYLLAQERMLAALIPYENAHVFGFSDDFSFITNLDNYMDKEHFSEETNAALLDAMYRGEHRLTEENYRQYIANLRAFYTNYDYDAIFADTDKE